ncbi:putative nuclease HARBI1 [Puntigrus tetrazona]|uniref:putative nuclease HARBI1 n=1 Tax=Puntigrus tetrazona TaxID=1606681 RepID=UPI001C895563|nr:putative nuclease HARBI1 [Puntigrus tetrazona]
MAGKLLEGSPFPEEQNLEALVEGFPNVIGCIDGTRIPFKAPSINEGDYVNRKSVHSINVQVICEATQIITNVEAKWPGFVHDAKIFRESSLCQAFQQGQYNGYLLVDRGYPCLPCLMTPYPEPEPGPQTRFNLAHSRTRAEVEMTIGILKSRFQCLRGLRVSPERACDIIVACVVLHNIASIRGESHPPCIEEDGPEEHLQILQESNQYHLSLIKAVKSVVDKHQEELAENPKIQNRWAKIMLRDSLKYPSSWKLTLTDVHTDNKDLKIISFKDMWELYSPHSAVRGI